MATEAAAAAAEQETMDPELWGNLQFDIDLRIIYAKLPFRHFFQLRLVCKEWNLLASDTAFLNATYKDFLLPEPYFVLRSSPYYIAGPEGLAYFADAPDGKVRGLLAWDSGTEQWTLTRLPDGNKFWSAAGLAVIDSPDSEGSLFVINLHTRHRFLLPPSPKQMLQLYPYMGMEVDTAARPYQYKIMQGHDDIPTQIYDSRTNTWSTKTNTWRAKPSHDNYLSKGLAMGAFARGVFVIHCDDRIVIYDTAKDVWDEIKPPPDAAADDFVRGMGIWRDRIFLPSMRDDKAILVWELTHIVQQVWTEVATMPAQLSSWLLYEDNEPPMLFMSDIHILASYCFQWILIYAWWEGDDVNDDRGERFVILDLEKMEFRKLELPFGPLNKKFRSHGDLYPVCRDANLSVKLPA